MPEIFYLGKKKYDIPDSLTSDFLGENPDAVKGINYTLEGKQYNIPENLQESFLQENPSAQIVAQEAPLEQQATNITYEDEELNQVNNEIATRVDSFFTLPKELPVAPDTVPTAKTDPIQQGTPPSEYTISAAPAIEPNIFGRFKEYVKDIFLKTETAKNAEAQLQYAISQEHDLPLDYVKENYDELIRSPEVTGISPDPTLMESIEFGFTGAVVGGLFSHPLMTAMGVGAFWVLDETENAIISKIQGDAFVWGGGKNISDLLPEDATRATKEFIEIVDLIGKGAIVGAGRKQILKGTGLEGEFTPSAWKDAGWKAKFIKNPEKFVWEKITKEYITEYSMPPTMHIDPAKVKAILVTGDKTKFSKVEADLLKELGIEKGVYKRAVKDGITIEVPSEKVVNLVDKPWWAKAKAVFGKPRSVQEVSRTTVGGKKVKETARGLLPEAQVKAPKQPVEAKKPSKPKPVEAKPKKPVKPETKPKAVKEPPKPVEAPVEAPIEKPTTAAVKEEQTLKLNQNYNTLLQAQAAAQAPLDRGELTATQAKAQEQVLNDQRR